MKLYVLALTALFIACFANVSLADTTAIVLPSVTVHGKPSPVIPDGARELRCVKQALVQGTIGSVVKVCTWTK